MGFAERFPRWITAMMGIAQIVLTGAIIGLEVASVNVDLVHGTIWAGFWCSIVFVPTCFMMILISTYLNLILIVVRFFSGSLLLLQRSMLCYLCFNTERYVN